MGPHFACVIWCAIGMDMTIDVEATEDVLDAGAGAQIYLSHILLVFSGLCGCHVWYLGHSFDVIAT